MEAGEATWHLVRGKPQFQGLEVGVLCAKAAFSALSL